MWEFLIPAAAGLIGSAFKKTPKPKKTAEQATDWLAGAGEELGGKGTPGGQGMWNELGGVSPELQGYGNALPYMMTNLYSMYDPAKASQFGAMMGTNYQDANGQTQNGWINQGNPYDMNANQQQAFNIKADQIRAQQQTAMNSAQQAMVSGGVNDPMALQNAQRQIGEDYSTRMSQELTGAQQGAFDQKTQAMMQMMGLTQGLYGAQQTEQSNALQRLLAASGLMSNAAGQGVQLAGMDYQNQDSNMSGWGQLAALLGQALPRKKDS